MKIESTAILYIGIMFLLALLFCKTVEVVVERTRRIFVGTNDALEPIKMELNALNIKIDGLQLRFDSKFDALQAEIDAVNAKAVPRGTEQLSVVPDSPMPMLEDTYSISEDSWTRDGRVSSEGSIAPLVPADTSSDTWTRDTVANESGEGAATAARKNKSAQLRLTQSNDCDDRRRSNLLTAPPNFGEKGAGTR